MPVAPEVQYAKKDIYADVEDEFNNKIRRLVAVEGQPVPAAYTDLVNDSDVTTELPKTEQTAGGGLAVRSTAARREALAERKEPTHEEAREAAAATPGPEEEREARKARRRTSDKARRGAGDKAERQADGEK